MTTKEDLRKEIENEPWIRGEYGEYNLTIHGPLGRPIRAWITRRPDYCDRGHVQLQIDGVQIDGADGFPRYFFSFDEADKHCRAFLKWRLLQMPRRKPADVWPSTPLIYP